MSTHKPPEPTNSENVLVRSDPPDDFLPEDRPEVRRSIWAMHLETQRMLEESEKLVWKMARSRGILGISTST